MIRVATLVVSILLLGAGREATADATIYDDIVDQKGNIALPDGFGADTDIPTDFVPVGSFAVVNEGGEGNGIHEVYTTPGVSEAYRKTGQFPDKAVFVKSVRNASAATMTTGRAHWATDQAVWFVMVKDAVGRFEGNPLWGDGWGWALFNAADPSKQVATNYKSDCLGCHQPVKNTDWIHVFGYPSFGEAARKQIPEAYAPN